MRELQAKLACPYEFCMYGHVLYVPHAYAFMSVRILHVLACLIRTTCICIYVRTNSACTGMSYTYHMHMHLYIGIQGHIYMYDVKVHVHVHVCVHIQLSMQAAACDRSSRCLDDAADRKAPERSVVRRLRRRRAAAKPARAQHCSEAVQRPGHGTQVRWAQNGRLVKAGTCSFICITIKKQIHTFLFLSLSLSLSLSVSM